MLFAHEVKMIGQECNLLISRWLARYLSCRVILQLPKNPRVKHCSSPNGNSSTSCFRNHRISVVDRPNVSVGNNRHRPDRSHSIANSLSIDATVKSLLSSTSMHGDCSDADAFK